MARNAKPAPKDSRGLLTWAEISPWQRDNEFILTGYRRATFSYFASAKSIFHIHNETANIWSHLLGALLFVVLFGHFFFRSRLPDGLKIEDGLAVGTYFIGVVVCFVLSTVYHTFYDHSPHIHKFGNELDHLGIVLVMWGTGVSGAYFGFYHDKATRNLYLALLTATGVGFGFFTLKPKFRRPEYRLTRFLMYAGLGASLFDLLGQSHNWMHVLVLTGALVRLEGLLTVARRWQEESGMLL
ncbi:hemolysin-III related-domain-containing protein [Lasiosphaeris hirsuta]|uniref:Hemolysin-III related-domain-containing protein n=1 Tax=Lasiosphaeris hirsuta TaxID=260670 RepID=A0AA40A2J7_9PEZI|nr:hemolysin-III related-domain-containing protein [Lasiosphaeris hirsuta]